MITLYLGILLFSFFISSILIVPFISISYRYLRKSLPPPVGGIFLVLVIPVLFAILLPILQKLGVSVNTTYPVLEEINVIFFTLISFSLLGIFKDLSPKKISPLLFLIIQIVLAFLVAGILYFNLGIGFINIPNFEAFRIGWFMIPLTFGVVMLFSSVLQKSDHIDGFVPGVLFISLLALWIISISKLDTLLSIFVAIWIGSLLSVLYFTVYPSRISLGQTGTLGLGATFALIGLLLGKSIALFVVGGLFFVFPLLNKLQTIGWPVPKIMLRGWLIGLMLAVFGLWLAFL